jgi:phage tail-like protein
MSEYDFSEAYKKAFPTPKAPESYDYGTARQNSGVQRSTYTPMTLEQMGPTVSSTPGTTPNEASQGRRDYDHIGDYNFVITIDGIEAGAFKKCDGLSVDIDVVEYRDGMSPYPLKRPGMRRFGDIKLTKGQTTNRALWDWCESIMSGKIDPRGGAIEVIPEDGDDGCPITIYQFTGAWPKKWSGMKLDGMGKGALVEEIVLAVESLSRG